VGEGYGPWAEIKRHSRPGVVAEVAFEVGVGGIELVQLNDIVQVESRSEDVKGRCRKFY
jgi:hypothetical protein